jgi:integrase
MPRLTKRTVDDTRPDSSQRIYVRDDDLKGFGLTVTPSGAKSYFVEYRLPGGRAAAKGRIVIGRHGSPWTPDSARREAINILAAVRRGIDPKEQRKIDDDLAFSNYADGFLARSQSLRSIKHMTAVFRLHITPVFRSTPLPTITRAAVSRLIADVAAGSPATAHYVHAVLRRLFRTAVSRGDLQASPMQDMEPPASVASRDRVLTGAEISALWKAASSLSARFGTAIRLLILTGQRRSEVLGMDFSELDVAGATWTIPASRSKNGLAHVVPLSPPAMAKLIALGADSRREGLVFTTTGTTPISGVSKMKRALDRLMGEPPAWRLHDIRRTVATGLQRLGIRFEVTEAVLNHVSGAKSGIAGVYQRHDWKDEKRAALDAWAAHVLAVIDEGAAASNVVTLRR